MIALLFALAGLAGFAALFAGVGVAPVFQAVEAAGWTGVLLLAGWQLLLTFPLALAWGQVTPGVPFRPLAWARLVREAAGACLPFTAVGGIVVGARVLAQDAGLSGARAGAATAADVALEFVAQVAFILLGVALLFAAKPDGVAWVPLGLGVLAAALAAAATLGLQGRPFRALVRRVGVDRLGGAPADALAAELERIHADPRRLALGAAFHLAAWLGSGVITWEAFRLLGAPVHLGAALAIEALLGLVRVLAFFVPGALGVQEAGYVGLAALYGVGAPAALGVSLLRRARELLVGVPVLLWWQADALRRLAPRRATGA